MVRMNKTLGQRIRELREELDLSLREMAEKIDAAPAHVSDIELGRRNPSEALLAKIAHILRVTIEELRQYDTRLPGDELKKIIEQDPAYGFALRKLAEKNVSAEDILKWAEHKPKREEPK
jgi:transcriptional regulator with XRE-family HTH domain